MQGGHPIATVPRCYMCTFDAILSADMGHCCTLHTVGHCETVYCVFTALHCMQRGPSHRNGVRLSVRLSVTA